MREMKWILSSLLVSIEVRGATATESNHLIYSCVCIHMYVYIRVCVCPHRNHNDLQKYANITLL